MTDAERKRYIHNLKTDDIQKLKRLCDEELRDRIQWVPISGNYAEVKLASNKFMGVVH